MLLGAGGFTTGALVEPGPGVLPGAHGAAATVAEVPGVVVLAVPGVVVVAVVELVVLDPTVDVPAPLTLELLLVEGVAELPIELLVLGVEVDVLEFPTLVPLFAGVQGATVVEVPERPVVVP
jgi:hypothetical protein